MPPLTKIFTSRSPPSSKMRTHAARVLGQVAAVDPHRANLDPVARQLGRQLHHFVRAASVS